MQACAIVDIFECGSIEQFTENCGQKNSVLNYEQSKEIINWYEKNGRYIWNYHNKPVRLVSVENGFGIEFKLSLMGWVNCGDYNEHTFCFFNNYNQWFKFKSSFEEVDVDLIADLLDEYAVFFNHDHIAELSGARHFARPLE